MIDRTPAIKISDLMTGDAIIISSIAGVDRGASHRHHSARGRRSRFSPSPALAKCLSATGTWAAAATSAVSGNRRAMSLLQRRSGCVLSRC